MASRSFGKKKKFINLTSIQNNKSFLDYQCSFSAIPKYIDICIFHMGNVNQPSETTV